MPQAGAGPAGPPGRGGRAQNADEDPDRPRTAAFDMQISARNVLAAAALAAVAAGAAAQGEVLENLADSATDALTGFFGNLNSALNSMLDWTSFA